MNHATLRPRVGWKAGQAGEAGISRAIERQWLRVWHQTKYPGACQPHNCSLQRFGHAGRAYSMCPSGIRRTQSAGGSGSLELVEDPFELATVSEVTRAVHHVAGPSDYCGTRTITSPLWRFNTMPSARSRTSLH